jgi:hypothetical protein
MAAAVPGASPQYPSNYTMIPQFNAAAVPGQQQPQIPPMPFQTGLNPTDNQNVPPSFAYNVISPTHTTSHPPSSAGALSVYSDTPATQPYVGAPHPAVYASGAGVLGGIGGFNPLFNLNRGAERQLESDQVPLTSAQANQDVMMSGGLGTVPLGNDYGQGFHAPLSSIGEEDEEDGLNGQKPQDQGISGGYRDNVTPASSSTAVGSGVGMTTGQGYPKGYEYQQEYSYQAQGAPQQAQQQPLPEGVKEGGPDEGRPLWQQNRRQSRNLVWM